MTSLIGLVLGLCVLICAVPVLVFLAQMVAAMPPLRSRPQPSLRRPTLAILIPAHDEDRIIAATVAGLLPELAKEDRLVVVADNCRDGTATMAREAGAEVLERHDLAQRGKGFALDAGLRFLDRTGPREIVVFVDADCTMSPGGIDRIARLSASINAPVQAAYVMVASPTSSSSQRMGAFAAIVKTFGRPLGWSRLGFPCHLSGTGIAIPARLLGSVNVANAHLTEDLKLGMDLALAGAPPRFCPEAQVLSTLPESDVARHSQQTRWEHGHLALIQAYAPNLFRKAWGRRNVALLALALDLCVPPLAALVLAVTGLTVLALKWSLLTGNLVPVFASASLLFLLGLALGLAWFRWGRELVGWRDILASPRFIARKASILLKFVSHRQVEWVRTDRGAGPAAPKAVPAPRSTR